MFKKADWEGLENHMLLFQKSFLVSHEGKSVNLLWEEFKGALQSGIKKHVPQRTMSTKPSLPWMTQEIKRVIRKRDSLYDKYKKYRRPTDRYAFVEARQLAKQNSSRPLNRYIEEILSLTNSSERSKSNGQPSPDIHKSTYASKKLFSLFKNSKQALPHSRRTVSCILILWTRQTFSTTNFNVFTSKSPLELSQLASMAMQDLMDSGANDPLQVPGECLSTTSHMESIFVSVNGIVKLLKDLNPHKAAGPHQLKRLVLQRLRDVIAPVLQVIFQRSLDTGMVPKDWSTAFVCPLFKKKGDNSLASNYRLISMTSILCKALDVSLLRM